jgi:hypothetical protein
MESVESEELAYQLGEKLLKHARYAIFTTVTICVLVAAVLVAIYVKTDHPGDLGYRAVLGDFLFCAGFLCASLLTMQLTGPGTRLVRMSTRAAEEAVLLPGFRPGDPLTREQAGLRGWPFPLLKSHARRLLRWSIASQRKKLVRDVFQSEIVGTLKAE